MTGISNCYQSDQGYGVLTHWAIDATENQMLTLLVTAYTTKLTIKVIEDTTNHLSGLCRATSVTLQ